jgi:hypothetical protein
MCCNIVYSWYFIRNNVNKRRIWWYQNPLIEGEIWWYQNPLIEGETIQWPKEKGQKDKQQYTKYTHETKYLCSPGNNAESFFLILDFSSVVLSRCLRYTDSDYLPLVPSNFSQLQRRL